MCACREPSLTPRESVQWAAYVVVKTLAPIARAHPDPRVFEALVRGMAEVEADEGEDGEETKTTTGARRWYPLRYALGWLLLGELQREPRAAGSGAGAGAGVSGGVSVGNGGRSEAVDDVGVEGMDWAAALAGRLAAEAKEQVAEGAVGVAPANEYSTGLFGAFQVGGDVDDDARGFFGVT